MFLCRFLVITAKGKADPPPDDVDSAADLAPRRLDLAEDAVWNKIYDIINIYLLDLAILEFETWRCQELGPQK